MVEKMAYQKGMSRAGYWDERTAAVKVDKKVVLMVET